VQAAPDLQPRRVLDKPTQAWVRVALLIGSGIGIAWAAFLSQFMNEPSAVGRSKAVLVIWAVISLTTAVLALPVAIMLRRRDRSGRALAWVVSILMTITFVGAVAGVPALIGLLWSRNASSP
jgi:uncharacterized membrane protein